MSRNVILWNNLNSSETCPPMCPLLLTVINIEDGRRFVKTGHMSLIQNESTDRVRGIRNKEIIYFSVDGINNFGHKYQIIAWSLPPIPYSGPKEGKKHSKAVENNGN